jgi:hypothetical protein
MSDTRIPQAIPTGMSLTMFNRSLQKGWLRQSWAKITRRCLCLVDLDELLSCCPVERSHFIGHKTVNIDSIRGTQGKADEFDRGFYPTQERSRSRWMGIALEKLRGRDLPPVELIQIGDSYYVRDGHHRISVSRAMGQDFIDAEITVMELGPQMCDCQVN